MSSNVITQLESFLTLTNRRETVIAGNVANLDTPGYRTQDIDFQQALAHAVNNPGTGADQISVRKVPNLLERADGNNVDLDRESLLLSQSQLQYQMGTQLLKSRFHQLLTAINGGGGA